MRDIELTKTVLKQACESIENVFAKEGVELKKDSWLDKSLKIIKRLVDGQIRIDPNSFKAHRIMTVITLLGEDLMELQKRKIPLKEKLERFHKSQNSDSRLHEISALAGLLRNNFLAEFIPKEQGRETPDIRLISREGAVECKIARSFERVIERIDKAHDQLKDYPGIKIVDVFLYFSITDAEIPKFCEAVFERVKRKMVRAEHISGLQAINLRFLESKILENGKLSTAFKAYYKVDETFSHAKEVLRAFEEH